ncbi:MAG: M48 metallopeptidase family protein [Actinomycetes bacterium]
MSPPDSDARPERPHAGQQEDSPAWGGQPVESGPADTDQVDRDPVETGPVRDGPVETSPVEGDRVETGPVEVRRSARRRRTVTAYRDGDRTVVLIPARMSRTEERRWVAQMLERLEMQERRRRPSDSVLLARARELCRQYLDGRVQPSSVRWVTNQGSRWGSCTVSDSSIRLSHRLRGMPAWVVDYVLLHECAHLIEPGHGKAFWALVEGYPRAERARGYLEGVSAAAGLSLSDEADG